jgi:phenylacetate-CoA ligase
MSTNPLDRTKGYFDSAVETQPWTEKKIRLNRLLIEAINYAFDYSRFMKNRMTHAGISPKDIRSVKDLSKIPVTRKDELIKIQKESKSFGGLLAVPVEQLERIYLSPGPIFDPHQADAYARYATALYALGFREKDIVLNTFSYHMTPAGHMFDTALKILKCPIIPSGVGNTELQIEILRRTRVTGFVGMATFLSHIYEKAEETGINPAKEFNLVVAFAGGEPAGGPLREALAKKYRIMTGDIYGTADLGPVAYECSAKTGMHLIDDAVVEIVNPANGQSLPEGEIGEIVVTPFNRIYPLIRFGTGDLSQIFYNECPCGRTSPRISKIMGRAGDSIRVRGMLVHKNQIMEIVNSLPELKGFKLIVSRSQERDYLRFKVGLQEMNADTTRLSKLLMSKIQDICHIRVDQIDFEPTEHFRDELSVFSDMRDYKV